MFGVYVQSIIHGYINNNDPKKLIQEDGNLSNIKYISFPKEQLILNLNADEYFQNDFCLIKHMLQNTIWLTILCIVIRGWSEGPDSLDLSLV